MAVVGYARVSTEDQSTEGQILDLQKFGCTEIFRENASGADRDRPQLTFPHQPGKGRWVVSSERGRVPSGKFGGIQSGRPSGSSSGAGDLLRRVLGRAGPVCSASSRRRDRGLCVVLLSLSTSVLTRTVERHSR